MPDIIVPIELLRRNTRPATMDDITAQLSLKRTSKSVQFFQILRYLRTDELVAILTEIGFATVATQIATGWLVVSEKGLAADLQGLDAISGEETRDMAVKRLLREACR